MTRVALTLAMVIGLPSVTSDAAPLARQRSFGTPSLSLLPGGGMTVGVSGRF